MMNVLRAAGFIVVATFVAATPLFAQRGTLRGRVHVEGDSLGVSGAVVALAEKTQTTDSAGAFFFSGVQPGHYELTIRRMGFHPYLAQLDYGDSTGALNIALDTMPDWVDTMRVNGRLVHVPYRYEAVYRRATAGSGHLIPREEIEARHPFYTRDLLDGLPGIAIISGRVRFCKCGGCFSAGRPGDEHADLFIDGERYMAAGADIEPALDRISPADIQAIEVYASVAEIPQSLHASGCAAIAIWLTTE
jgi:hypothetical protein